MSERSELELTIKHPRKDQLFDPEDAFELVRDGRKILPGVFLKQQNQVISTSQFEQLKSFLTQLSSKALDSALDLLLNCPDRSSFVNKEAVFFLIDRLELPAYSYNQATDTFSAEIVIGLECFSSDNYPVFMYDARGCVEAVYTIEPGNKILESRISFSE